MVKHMYRIGTILHDRGYESCRQVCCHMFYLYILTYDFPPEFLQSFRTLSIANIDYPATVQIHDNRVVLIQIYNIYSGFFFILSVLSLQIPEEPDFLLWEYLPSYITVGKR